MNNMRKWMSAACLVAVALVGCSQEEKKVEKVEEVKPKTPVGAAPYTKLGIKEVKPGTGPAAAMGDLAVVIYTGKFRNGEVFDTNSAQGGVPLNVIIGETPVIQGWTQGLVGMKKGSERDLSIPFSLAYGTEGREPTIPGSTDLDFNVKCLYVVKKNRQGDYEATDTKVGTGPAAKKGDKVSVHYVGMLLNGTEFDASRPRGAPLDFQIGAQGVIQGMEDGVIGMKVGGKRRLIVPPALGYGAEQKGDKIAPNSVLVFDVELMKIN